jgi:hypothetical protein
LSGTTLCEQLEFAFEFGCPFIEAEYYRDGAQDLIQKIVPEELLFAKGFGLSAERARFADMLPLIRWSELTKAPCSLSVVLLCKYRQNASQFFHEMVSRWLLPNRRVNVELFFTSDVRLPHLSEELLSVAEIVIQLKSVQEVEEARRNISAIETEIRLGIVSHYHARRILEFKGLSADGKTAMIQEKIGSLIQGHSKEYDPGIFSQMQNFLVNSDEAFKKVRDYHHISRLISNLYSVRKVLLQNMEALNGKRHVQVKFLKTRIKVSERSGLDKPVLGILVGMNCLAEHEVFEEEHLLAAVRSFVPQAEMVEGSSFAEKAKGEPLQALYLEVEKKSGFDFTQEEVQALRAHLPEKIKGHVEQLAHPIFMPRNEEEVLRGIMALSRQIRYVNDPTQGILSFDEQRGGELCFTAVIVRVLADKSPSIEELIAKSGSPLKFIPDRVRKLGVLRRKYVKEASVCRLLVPSRDFLRPDRSVDLYKARLFIYQELCKAIGPIRDYNGGMIVKQHELLSALREGLGKQAEHYPLLLEQFFYSITPIEMRSAIDPEPLKSLFSLLLQMVKKGSGSLIRQEPERLLAVVAINRNIQQAVSRLNVPNHQLVSFSLDSAETPFAGYILFSDEEALRSQFLRALSVSMNRS